MTLEAISEANDLLGGKSPSEVIEWAIAQADGRAILQPVWGQQHSQEGGRAS